MEGGSYTPPTISSADKLDHETRSVLFSCRSTGAKEVDSRNASVREQNVDKMSSFKLEPKHKIFLSHSGAQKNFVEQLCVDLEARGYFFPFFDQRSHSLPKGKTFPTLIKEAARQCHVAVIVLSEEFLTSKWPMIELAEFHGAQQEENKQLNMLPLFFKLSVHDLDDQSIEDRWMTKWKELAGKDKRIDLNKWRAAVKALRNTNGLSFDKFANREVPYRSAVTQEIFKLSPPDVLYGTSKTVVGCDRLSEMLANQFEEDSKTGIFFLGLYGMSGLGKTTMSRALCDYFHKDFLGKVCHVELGVASRSLVRLKEVLQKLCGFDGDSLDKIKDSHQGQEWMQKFMARQPVFLVIDNVGNDKASWDEAQMYLETNFHPNSKVMVTSRSKEIVGELLFESKFCKPIPNLTEEEAGTIFLKKAAPQKILSKLTIEEKRILHLCVQQCWFPVNEPIATNVLWNSNSNRQYHPLALQALGSYFSEISNKCLQPWEKYIEDVDKLKLSRESPSIFGILGLQFSTFEENEQLLFLDIALYGEEWIAAVKGDRESPVLEDWVTWLTGLHGERPKDVERNLKHLRKSGMINWEPYFTYDIDGGITMHQLYKEYAEWHVTKGEGSKNVWCIYQTSFSKFSPLYKKLVRGPPSKYWPDLMRIRIVGLKGFIPTQAESIQEWSKVELLQLHHCNDVKELNLHGFRCLCHLELIDLQNLEILTFSENYASYEEVRHGRLDSLHFALFEGLDSIRHLPHFESWPSLQVIIINNCCNLAEYPRISRCSELTTMLVSKVHPYQKGLSFIGLTSLNELNLCAIATDDVLHLSGLPHLHFLKLQALSARVLSLENLPQVKVLELQCLSAKSFIGLTQLTSLFWLDIEFCFQVIEIPGLNPISPLGVHFYYAKRKGKPMDYARFTGHMMEEWDISKAKWQEFVYLQEESDTYFENNIFDCIFNDSTGLHTYYYASSSSRDKHQDYAKSIVDKIYIVKTVEGVTYFTEEILDSDSEEEGDEYEEGCEDEYEEGCEDEYEEGCEDEYEEGCEDEYEEGCEDEYEEGWEDEYEEGCEDENEEGCVEEQEGKYDEEYRGEYQKGDQLDVEGRSEVDEKQKDGLDEEEWKGVENKAECNFAEEMDKLWRRGKKVISSKIYTIKMHDEVPYIEEVKDECQQKHEEEINFMQELLASYRRLHESLSSMISETE